MLRKYQTHRRCMTLDPRCYIYRRHTAHLSPGLDTPSQLGNLHKMSDLQNIYLSNEEHEIHKMAIFDLSVLLPLDLYSHFFLEKLWNLYIIYNNNDMS